MNNVQIGLELFEAVQELEMVKCEVKESKYGNQYCVVEFDQCVSFDPENPRKTKCINVPYFLPMELVREHFTGCKPSELVGKRYTVQVQFIPKLDFNNGKKFVKTETIITDISEVF